VLELGPLHAVRRLAMRRVLRSDTVIRAPVRVKAETTTSGGTSVRRCTRCGGGVGATCDECGRPVERSAFFVEGVWKGVGSGCCAGAGVSDRKWPNVRAGGTIGQPGGRNGPGVGGSLLAAGSNGQEVANTPVGEQAMPAQAHGAAPRRAPRERASVQTNSERAAPSATDEEGPGWRDAALQPGRINASEASAMAGCPGCGLHSRRRGSAAWC
jgi:hypothetical protein